MACKTTRYSAASQQAHIVGSRGAKQTHETIRLLQGRKTLDAEPIKFITLWHIQRARLGQARHTWATPRSDLEKMFELLLKVVFNDTVKSRSNWQNFGNVFVVKPKLAKWNNICPSYHKLANEGLEYPKTIFQNIQTCPFGKLFARSVSLKTTISPWARRTTINGDPKSASDPMISSPWGKQLPNSH